MERKERTKKKGWLKMRRGREKLVAVLPIYMCMCEKERKREILYYVKKKKEREETKEDLDR